MTTSSHNAYIDEANKQSRKRHKDIVFASIQRGPKSANEICADTGLTYSAVMKRIPDLADEGLIYPSDERDKQSVWALVTDESKKQYAKQKRENEKYTAWLKRGLKDFPDRLPHHVAEWIESKLNPQYT
jgi:predicted transcriptional regulator